MIISIDLETTGFDPNTCQILEIGAVAGDNQFHCYVENDLIHGEPYALQMNHAILKKIADGISGIIHPDGVALRFADWLSVLEGPFTIAGKNFAAFDKQFLDKLFDWKKIKFDHRIIDVGNLYWRPKTDGDKLPNLQTCMRRAGILVDVPHTALEDAIIVQRLVEYWKNYV